MNGPKIFLKHVARKNGFKYFTKKINKLNTAHLLSPILTPHLICDSIIVRTYSLVFCYKALSAEKKIWDNHITK